MTIFQGVSLSSQFYVVLALRLESYIFAPLENLIEPHHKRNKLLVVDRGIVHCQGQVRRVGYTCGEDALSAWRSELIRGYQATALSHGQVIVIQSEDLFEILSRPQFSQEGSRVLKKIWKLMVKEMALIFHEVLQECASMASQDEGLSIMRKRFPFVSIHKFDVFETIHNRFYATNQKNVLLKRPQFNLSTRHSEILQAGLRYSESLQQEDVEAPQMLQAPVMKIRRSEPINRLLSANHLTQTFEPRSRSNLSENVQRGKSYAGEGSLPFKNESAYALACEENLLTAETSVEIEQISTFLLSAELDDPQLSKWLVLQENMTASILQNATESQLHSVGIPMGNVVKLLNRRQMASVSSISEEKLNSF
eukprot:CAMPEP_0196573542 /NCGR_PEP_ID=MMETSP1081-20130531/3429_1 /TAXON_ID=36882 /ORGANISM="Pyramimonas amylifera, Strain CCMP720" /LENGTH=365 /DNA_ID=CAMNT_0041891285 /DNA_START=37 /DNA_END=1134 /DNA_ORIENTATION=-